MHRMFAYLTQGPVARRVLKHLKLADSPPPLAPGRTGRNGLDRGGT